MLKIVPVPPSQIPGVNLPALAYVGTDEGEIVGSGGLAWSQDGRCWIWLDTISSKPEYAIPLMRQTKRLIAKAKQLGEREIFTPRDDAFQTSEKLLTVLRFHRFAIENGIEVWRVAL